MPRQRQPHLRWDQFYTWLCHRLPPERHNMTAIAEHLDINSRSLWRWSLDGIPFHTADAIAIGLGAHPSEIWGDDYWEADLHLEEPDEPDSLMPEIA